MPAWRHGVLAAALIASVVASFVDWPQDAVAPPPATRQRTASAPAAAPNATVAAAGAAARRPVMDANGPNLFAARVWQQPLVPAGPGQAPEAAPAPPIPPLPFVYFGRLMQDGQTVAFVGQGTRTLLLRAGDELPPYRVLDISATGMTFLHTALDHKQRLNFGTAN